MCDALAELRGKLQAQELTEQLARVQRHLLVQRHTLRLQERSAQLLLGKLLTLHERLVAFAPRKPPPQTCEVRKSTAEVAENEQSTPHRQGSTRDEQKTTPTTACVSLTTTAAAAPFPPLPAPSSALFVSSEANCEVFWPATWPAERTHTLETHIPQYVWALRPDQLRRCVEQRLTNLHRFCERCVTRRYRDGDDDNAEGAAVQDALQDGEQVCGDASAAAAALLAVLTPQLTSLCTLLTCLTTSHSICTSHTSTVTTARSEEEEVHDEGAEVEKVWQTYWLRTMYAVLHEATVHLRHFFALSTELMSQWLTESTRGEQQMMSLTEQAVQQAAFDAAACAEAVQRVLQPSAVYDTLLRIVTTSTNNTPEDTCTSRVLSVAYTSTSSTDEVMQLPLPPALFSAAEVHEAFGFLRDLCGV